MGFSARQTQALKRELDRRHVRTREAHGRELSYLEGWYLISEANRIFGYDGWTNRGLLNVRFVRKTIVLLCCHEMPSRREARARERNRTLQWWIGQKSLDP